MTNAPGTVAPPVPPATARPVERAHPGRLAAVAGAACFFLASVTPSLIPRSWYLQGLASGLSAAYGYGLGLVVAWCWRRLRDAVGLRITMAPGPARWLWLGCRVVFAVVVAGTALWSLQWQRDTARLVGVPLPGPRRLLLGLACSVLVFVLVIALARGLRALVRRSSRLGQRFLRPRVATGLAALLVAALVLVLSNSVLY